MLNILARNWWMIAIRGLVAVIFGLAAIAWPDMTLVVLVMLFGAYALVDGLFAMIAAIRDRTEHRQWWLVLVEGVVGIMAGVLAFIWPGITALALLYLIAGWAIMTGLFEIAAAILLRKELEGEWLLILSGILSLLFGVVLALQPGAGALGIVWLIGVFAILFGTLMIVLAFRLRGWQGTLAAA